MVLEGAGKGVCSTVYAGVAGVEMVDAMASDGVRKDEARWFLRPIGSLK